jgi:hypothetical protein
MKSFKEKINMKKISEVCQIFTSQNLSSLSKLQQHKTMYRNVLYKIDTSLRYR